MFLFKSSKKELDITDALTRKRATITIGGQPVVIEAFKLSRALELLELLGSLAPLAVLAQKDMAAFNRILLAKLPEILAFCAPGIKIRPEDVTLAEFADLTLAVWCVNDLERILQNFTQAAGSIAPTNAGFGFIAKILNENFAQKAGRFKPYANKRVCVGVCKRAESTGRGW